MKNNCINLVSIGHLKNPYEIFSNFEMKRLCGNSHFFGQSNFFSKDVKLRTNSAHFAKKFLYERTSTFFTIKTLKAL